MSTGGEYRVLARKYRPSSFSELVGHETLVRTLSNAFSSGRIAHAFMLTGIRGIGKTTTARLIARALNCVGSDGQGGPTIHPCGVCDPCRAIAEDRHPDVIEMDAASRTGVDDIRELIEGVRYRPVSARYKVYIIDEVHMLSRQAFNALLKTLEEPPPDIKFVFATTEINKVPITVLSRCQRYTLPRLPIAVLAGHYQHVAELEQVAIESEAVTLIARAADGSVRDGLSILDQAIALASGGAITATAVRDMLGVADRGLVYDLFELLMAGDAAAALTHLETFYNGGTDPLMVIQDLLEITHAITRLKVEGAATGAADDEERRRGLALAARLNMPALTRNWQILLKGLSEIQTAPHPLKAAEMVLVRLVYVTDLPSPGEIVALLQKGAPLNAATNSGSPSGAGAAAGVPGATPRSLVNNVNAPPRDAPRGEIPMPPRRQTMGESPAYPGPMISTTARALDTSASSQPAQDVSTREVPAFPQPQSFQSVVDLMAERREAVLGALVARHIRLVRFSPGRIEFQPEGNAPRDLSTKLAQFLLEATGTRWMISVTSETGAPTLLQQEEATAAARRAKAEAHPLVQAALAAFPGAVIERIRDIKSEPDSAVAGDASLSQPKSAPSVEGPADDVTPSLYEEDDPGPFSAYDPDDAAGEDI